MQARLTDAAAGDDLSANDLDDHDWLSVRLPFDLHRALHEAGRIPDPNHGMSDAESAWTEARDWWVRVPFAKPSCGPGERAQLVCHGLDTVATIYLNGQLLGSSNNMFRPFTYDVTKFDDGVLAICLHATDQPIEELRKAQFSHGWDFAPRRLTRGVWLPIEVQQQRVASIEAVQVQTTLTSASVIVTVDQFAPGELACELTFADQCLTVPVVGGSATAVFDVEDPQLWWTHDLGVPYLYDLAVKLFADGVPVDEDARRVGLRTIELDESPDDDEPGTAFFRFILNGVPIAIRGANWVPTDTAVMATEAHERLLTAARDAHMNMIRVWGGGIYEHDVFYDLCDRLGILVWQDLMFGNGVYPQDAQFVDEVIAEVRHQVRRLRNHPCLALWCGNNEVDMLADLLEVPAAGHQLFYEVLAGVVAEEGPGMRYQPTSPVKGNEESHGDRHAWQVWHGITEADLSVPKEQRSIAWTLDGGTAPVGSAQAKSYVSTAGPERYLDDLGRFISEYGLASAPCLETLAHHTDPSELVLAGPHVTHRLRPGKAGPHNKFDLMLDAFAGPPADLQNYVELSQLMQAEGLKLGAEHYRRRWPHCSGTLIWQLGDCWPSISWSLIDYDGRPKAAYYYARRFFTPVLASFKPLGTSTELWLTNDTLTPYEDDLEVSLKTFTGSVRWSKILRAEAPAQSSAKLGSWANAGTDSYCVVRSDRGLWNRHFFGPVGMLARGDRRPRYTVQGENITVTAEDYARMVQLASPDPLARFSDNYFDLEPGESRTVTGPSEFVLRSR